MPLARRQLDQRFLKPRGPGYALRAILVAIAVIATACSETPTGPQKLRAPVGGNADAGVVTTPTLSLTPSDVFIYPQDVAFTGTADPGATCTVFEEGFPLDQFVADASGTFSGTLSLGVGTHVLNATCTADGITSGVSQDVTATVLPGVTLSPITTTVPAGSTIFVTGTTAAFTQCAIQDNGTTIANVTADVTGNFSAPVVLSAGIHNITVTCTLNGLSLTTGYPLITAQPPIQLTASTPVTYPAPITFSGTTSPGANCVISAGGAQTSVTADAAGNFSGSLSLPAGNYTLDAVCIVNGAASIDLVIPVTVVADPVQSLKQSLIAAINSANLPPAITTRLLYYVNQLPATIAGLTPTQKATDIAILQNLIRVVQSLTPTYIPPATAAQIISLANQFIAALSA